MGKYCCFFCPAKDYTEKLLNDLCPTCARPYGFVLTHPPRQIGQYRVAGVLNRGFYGAAYVAEWGPFNRKCVVKISPVDFYQFFAKSSFAEETELHNRLASSAEHVVGISNRFDEEVIFSDDQHSAVACHVAVLDFVDGDPLRDYIDGKVAAGVATACQIAIDLLRLRAEFEANKLNHNDLHAENLMVERLSPQARRPNAVSDSIKVMAIDLGSIADVSKSSRERYGDLYFTAWHVDKLLDRLVANPSELDDRDFRTALALQGVVHGLLSSAQYVRQPNPNDLIEQIEEAYYRASQPWRPWSAPPKLKAFGDHYNALTLGSWDVPRLLVDPENRWLAEVTKPGPQIITGMRGCGKTMLLRALDIHARAVCDEGEAAGDVIARVKNDGFVGLFVSAQRLLDLRHSVSKLEHRLTRLFVHYALQASRALLHLRDLEPSIVHVAAHSKVGNAVADYLEGADDLRRVTSIEDLERRLEKTAVLTSRATNGYSVRQAPTEVFAHLAEQFRSCSSVLQSSTVFFLLDDVSTRYLEMERIEELLSGLLFQSPACAFKFTSEWQTIELGLQSPGRIHPIRIDRDVSVFDLGADVFQTINASGKGKGRDFVAQILLQRAKFHVSHPKFGPAQLLGDVPLEQVAREIASSENTSRDRKQAYRGLSCLTNVCVGDIGDVIKLYEEILKRAAAGRENFSFPISSSIQSDCFQDLSSRRLYDLNRRGGYYKSHALTFAEAAHELLVRSYRESKRLREHPPRLRQYSSIYVRVTSDDQQSLRQQIDQLRELIDAGVFVYAGGAPRSKTKDSNPIQQFKLSYRKIYGLASFVGLADRDRFELSGQDLEQWLGSPDKEILLRNQIGKEVEEGGDDPTGNQGGPLSFEGDHDAATNLPAQQALFGNEITIGTQSATAASKLAAKQIDVQIVDISLTDLSRTNIGGVLTGLGFEERTLASNRLFAAHTVPDVVHAIRYEEPGHAEEIRRAWVEEGRSIVEHGYSAVSGLPRIDGLALIDVSGLSKPLIFAAVRRELMEKGRVLVGHVSAEHHYPLQEDLHELFAAEQSQDPVRFLESLGAVLKGESGPYTDVRLLEEEVDPSRNRALLAFASAKHERLFSLLDRREFDYIQVIAPTGDAPRSRVASYAAEFICQNYQNAKVERIDSDDLVSLVRYLDAQFLDIYSQAGANLEIGLTGSKIQAVGSAVLSARRKIAQAWYQRPAKFDVARFSKGVGTARVFDISVIGAVRNSNESS